MLALKDCIHKLATASVRDICIVTFRVPILNINCTTTWQHYAPRQTRKIWENKDTSWFWFLILTPFWYFLLILRVVVLIICKNQARTQKKTMDINRKPTVKPPKRFKLFWTSQLTLPIRRITRKKPPESRVR